MAKALVLGGATGLLGQALVKGLEEAGWEVETLGRNDGDILNLDFLKNALERAKPDVVFNAIAWTNVDDAEDHPEEAARLNRALPDALARLISGMPDVHLVHYSTDFVFKGPHPGPWKEEDAPEPPCVYGKTKLEGEQAILKRLPDRSCIIRTAWLFGPDKKNFIKSIITAAQTKDALNVVMDQIGSPTYTVDLADWSVELASKRATGIWHGVNSGQASWCELASEALSLLPVSPPVIPILSSEWPQKATRPSYSVLDNSKLAAFLGRKPRPWPQALREYMYASDLVPKGAPAR